MEAYWSWAGVGLVLAALPGAAIGHGYKTKALSIHHPWTTVTAPGAAMATVGMRIANLSKQGDSLLGADSNVAVSAVLANPCQTRRVMALRLDAGTSVELTPSGACIELRGLKRAFAAYEMVPLTLHFARAGKVQVEVMVEEAPAAPSSAK